MALHACHPLQFGEFDGFSENVDEIAGIPVGTHFLRSIKNSSYFSLEVSLEHDNNIIFPENW